MLQIQNQCRNDFCPQIGCSLFGETKENLQKLNNMLDVHAECQRDTETGYLNQSEIRGNFLEELS